MITADWPGNHASLPATTCMTDTPAEKTHVFILYYKVEHIRGGPKNYWHIFVRLIISSNIDQFSNFSYCHNREKIGNNTIAKDSTAPQVSPLHYFVKCQCQKKQQLKTRRLL